ncbi:MAG: hypothetical protein HLUCCO02_11630 [Idiomarinaceae bacterium HL-53]|nr:MAG: hypothetical protein HLUCCO02_11630 [Idiomarinaceae bacterium HL-53]CUS47548.1 hypothetical protein Ga0003345_0481 [Idiomarinaceae bacterium HL-53]
MWELVSFVLAMAVFMFILEYMFEPKKLIEDIRGLKESSSKIAELERRVVELERLVLTEKQSKV